MTDRHTENWDNYWNGRASQESGNALIEVGIERNHELKTFWNDVFSQEDTSKKVIDFACGAGSVLEAAHKAGFTNLMGLDVSRKALDVMTKKIPGAEAKCAPVNKTGLTTNTYDIAVSQFGVEYAGNKENLHQAFKEIYRVLKPNGKIVIVAHKADGLIMEGCQNSLRQIKIIEDCEFIKTAQRVTAALHAPSEPIKDRDFNALTLELNGSAEPIMQWLKSFEDIESEKTKNKFVKFTYHLLESSHRLIAHHSRYSLEDSLKWFEGIQKELQAYKGRMLSMTKAALSSHDISELQKKLISEFGPNKITFEKPESIKFEPNPKPAAWIIRAKKH